MMLLSLRTDPLGAVGLYPVVVLGQRVLELGQLQPLLLMLLYKALASFRSGYGYGSQSTICSTPLATIHSTFEVDYFLLSIRT